MPGKDHQLVTIQDLVTPVSQNELVKPRKIVMTIGVVLQKILTNPSRTMCGEGNRSQL